MKLTPEQDTILTYIRQHSAGGEPIREKVEALAGCGKTTLLLKLVELLPDKEFLYLAFNKSVSDEVNIKAKERGLTTLKASTQNSWCFKLFQGFLGKRFKPLNNIKAAIKKSTNCSVTETDVFFVSGLIQQFCIQADLKFSVSLFTPLMSGKLEALVAQDLGPNPVSPKEPHPLLGQRFDERKAFLVKKAVEVFDTLMGQELITHDMYVKLCQIHSLKDSAPDIILLDEAQDINPSFAAIIQNQQQGIIAVGDSQQAIYRFRGASNFLDEFLPGKKAFSLTHSFRFPPSVAETANRVLAHLTDLRLVGRGSVDPSATGRTAYLQRTNSGCIRRALVFFKSQHPFYMDANFSAEERSAYEQLEALQVGRLDDVFYDELKDLNWRLFQDLLKKEAISTEWGTRLKVVELIGGFPAVFEFLKYLEKEMPEYADAPQAPIITTAHKSKGAEFPHVVIGGDFLRRFQVYDYEERCWSAPALDYGSVDELNLLYVALTRAQVTLDTSAIRQLLPDQTKKKEEGAEPIELAAGVWL